MPARISLAGPQSDVQGRMATATAGTGTLTLGAASPNATTFAAMPVPINDGDTLTYELVDVGVSPVGKEKGRGTYHSAGPTLSRDTVIWSTNGNARLTLSGNAFVFVTADDSDVVLASQARTLLTTATNFFFDTGAGNDNNPGTSASPWATPSPLGSRYDFGGQTVTLNLKNNAAVGIVIPTWTGGGNLVVDLGSHNVSNSSGSAITILGVPIGSILAIQNSGAISASGGRANQTAGIQHTGGGQLQLANITFDACAFAGLWVAGLGGGEPSANFVGPITFSGAAVGQSFLLFVAAGGVLTTGFINGTQPISASGDLANAGTTIGVNAAFATFQGTPQLIKNGHTLPANDTQTFGLPGSTLLGYPGWH